jgi:hypothetical protein
MSFWGSAAAAGAQIAGGMWSAHEARRAQREANQTNMQIAREQMQFQERMSNTAFQRQKDDMVKAGINPILAVSQGGGASTPAGSSTSVQSEATDEVNSAIQAARTALEFQSLRQQNKKISSDAELNKALTKVANRDAQVKSNTAREIATRTNIMSKDVPLATMKADLLTRGLNTAREAASTVTNKSVLENKLLKLNRWLVEKNRAIQRQQKR